MKSLVCSRSPQTNNSVRVGNEKMNLDQAPSPIKGGVAKTGQCRFRSGKPITYVVRAYSPITTASHSWLFNPLIAPGHTLFKNLLQRSHHSDSLDPSPLTTIALDRVEKQKTEQLLQSQEQSTIPRTRAQAWLNLTQRYR